MLRALAAQGWSPPDDGATHRTWIDGRFRPMAGHTARGERSERAHVRCFPLARGTLAAAHHEVADGNGPHRVTSWDAARAEVAEALEAAGYTRIDPSGPITAVNLRDVPGDGRAWRLVTSNAPRVPGT